MQEKFATATGGEKNERLENINTYIGRTKGIVRVV
jgi:hypothetical protein